MRAFKEGLHYCVHNNFLPLVMETNSLILKKIFDGIWEIPWSISVDIRCVKGGIEGQGYGGGIYF